MIKNIVKTAKLHTPELMIGAGVASMITSTVLAVKSTTKAVDIINDIEYTENVELTNTEKIKETWKAYIPSILTGAVGIGLIVGGTTKSLNRSTALASMYSASEAAYKVYKEKVKEEIGEEKANKIEKEIIKEKIKEVPVDNGGITNIYYTGTGEQLFYDTFSGRYFRSSIQYVETCVNKVNKHIINEFLMSVNDFYNELGIPEIGAGNLLGWKSEGELLEVKFDSEISEIGDTVIILAYSNKPRVLYDAHGEW